METNELISLTNAKNALSNEYFCLKHQMQLVHPEECSLSVIDDPVYDLVDKQYLFIQELFSKYNDLQSKLDYRKLFIESKANVFKEMHDAVLNRLLDKNYQQEIQIRELNEELNSLKHSNKMLEYMNKTEIKNRLSRNRDVNNSPNAFSNSIRQSINKDKDPIIKVNKKKAINVYDYNQKKNRLPSCSSLNTTTTSQSKFNIENNNNKNINRNNKHNTIITTENTHKTTITSPSNTGFNRKKTK